MNQIQTVKKQEKLLAQQKQADKSGVVSSGSQPVDALKEVESKKYAARKKQILAVMDVFSDEYQEAWDKKELNAGISRVMPDISYSLSEFEKLTEGKKHSGSAVELRNCLLEMKALTGGDTAQPPMEDCVEKLFELSVASASYCDSHQGGKWTYRGAARSAAAEKIRKMTRNYLYNLVSKEEGEKIRSNENADFLMGESMKSVTKDLKKAANAYKTFSAQIGNDCQAYTPQEILERRMKALRLNERKIRLYRMQYPDIAERDAGIQEMIEAYEEGLAWEMLRSFTKKQDEKGSSLSEMIEKHVEEEGEIEHSEKPVFAEENEGLEPEQIDAIEKIDNWLIRNFRNGGVAGLAIDAVKNAHEDFVSSLLSLSRRERLHVYYLVETGKRKNPSIIDVGASQSAVYKPDLQVFKNQMLATRWKFWTRVTGGYTYMNKLSQAFRRTLQYRKEIQSLSELNTDKKKLSEKIRENKEDPPQIQAAQKRLEKMIVFKGALEEYYRNLQAANKAKGKKKEAEEAKCQEAAAFCQELMKELVTLDNAVGKTQIGIQENPDSVETTETGASQVATVLSVPSMIHGGVSFVSDLFGGSWQLENAGWAEFNLWGGSIAGAAGCAANLIGAVTAFLSLKSEWGQLTEEDRTEKVLSIFGSVTSAADSVISVVGLVETAGSIAEDVSVSAATEAAGQVVGAVGSVISAGIAVAKTVGTGKMKYHGKNAQGFFLKKRENAGLEKELYGDLSKEKKRELKYEKNMMLLQNDLTRRAAKNASYAWVNAGLSVMSIAIPGIGVVSAGFTLITSILDSAEVTGIRTRLFDSFFNMDSLVEKATASKEAQRLLKLPDTKAVGQESFRASLRKRVAACAGFCDVHAAAFEICAKFAGLIRGKLFGGKAESEEEKNGYIEFVRSLNLPYDMEKGYPDENVLTRRLSAQ